MFKSIATVLMVLMGISSAHAGLTGYDWIKTPTDLKTIYLGGYVNGYTTGKMTGLTMGVLTTVDKIKKTSELIKNSSKNKSSETSKAVDYCSSLVSLNTQSYLAAALELDKEQPKEDLTYFIDEIDSLFQAYPLCKGKEIGASILPGLMMVWYKSGSKKLNYVDVGTECSK